MCDYNLNIMKTVHQNMCWGYIKKFLYHMFADINQYVLKTRGFKMHQHSTLVSQKLVLHLIGDLAFKELILSSVSLVCAHCTVQKLKEE